MYLTEVLVGIVATGLGWFLNMLYNKIEDHEKEDKTRNDQINTRLGNIESGIATLVERTKNL